MAPDIANWRDFFVTTATIAGALVGLLFVAISLHLRLLSDEHHSDLYLDARSNLIGYVLAMTLSLLPLVPQPQQALGAEIVLVSVLLTGISIGLGPRLLRSRRFLYARRYVWLRVALLAAADTTTLVGGVAFIAGQTWPLYLLAAGVLSVVIVSILRTWDIVFRAARAAPLS